MTLIYVVFIKYDILFIEWEICRVNKIIFWNCNAVNFVTLILIFLFTQCDFYWKKYAVFCIFFIFLNEL